MDIRRKFLSITALSCLFFITAAVPNATADSFPEADPFTGSVVSDPLEGTTDESPFTDPEISTRVGDDAENVRGEKGLVRFLPETPDDQAPSVALLAPANGAIVSGNITLSATASDDVAVAGVQFLVDGSDHGQESTLPPYQIQLDTTSLEDGAHTIGARVRDAAGNTADALPVNITVANNTPPQDEDNLIPNASLELEGGNGLPQSWHKGGFGTNNAILTYPVSGRTGARAVQIDITSYTDGDAKWYFDQIAVEPGKEYLFSDWYKSSVESYVNAQYLLSDGTFLYQDLGSTSPASDWRKFEKVMTVPGTATHVTIFHLIKSTGSLTVDDYSLTEGAPGAFPAGMVSLTFDDGWNSHYTNALPILENAGMKGSFYIVTNEMLAAASTSNLIINGSLQQTDGNGPIGWTPNIFGSSSASFDHPVPGVDDDSALRVEITDYSGGDAKWIFDRVPIEPATGYTFSNSYKSDVASDIIIEYLLTDNTFAYIPIDSLPPATDWTPYQKQFVTPSNAKEISIFQSISQVGSLTTDDYRLAPQNGSFPEPALDDYMNVERVRALEAAGHEIGSHTLTHANLPLLSPAEARAEIEESRQTLFDVGIQAVDTFVYPFGEFDDDIRQMVIDTGYKGARSVLRGFNRTSTDRFLLETQQVDRNTTQAQLQEWITNAKVNGTWLVLMFHQIDNGGDFYGNSPELLQFIVDEIGLQGLDVVTLTEGIDLME